RRFGTPQACPTETCAGTLQRLDELFDAPCEIVARCDERFVSAPRRIDDRPMLDARRSGPARAILCRRIADRDHDIKRVFDEQLRRLRFGLADVDADLRQRTDRV